MEGHSRAVGVYDLGTTSYGEVHKLQQRLQGQRREGGGVDTLLSQQHRDALCGHVHAEAGPLPSDGDDQRLYLINITHPAIHEQNLAIVPTQNEEIEVRLQPLIPVRHKVHLRPGNALFAVFDGFYRISGHCF